MPTLILVDAEKNIAIGSPYEIGESLTIGRASNPPTHGVDIPLQDPRISRPHMRILQMNDGRYCMEDLGSANGTLLNGQKLEPKRAYLINHQDRIFLGKFFYFIFLNPPIASQEDIANSLGSAPDTSTENGPFPGYEIDKIVEDLNGCQLISAKQKSLDRSVLLWVFPLSNVENTKANVNFTQDIFIERISKTAQLFHPNLMMLLDFSVSDQYCFCAFENVDCKKDLISYIKTYQDTHQFIPITKVLDFGMQLASGLHYTHQHQIYHLDLSARNILVHPGTKERLIISEFGVSSFIEATAHLRVSALIRENGQYLAPEYIQNVIDQKQKSQQNLPPSALVAQDIYAYGCLMYCVLTNEPPFYSNNLRDLYQMHLSTIPTPLSEKRPEIPAKLATLVHRCLDKNPQNRYQNFEQIMQELANISQEVGTTKQEPIQPTTEPTPATVPPKTLMRWWVVMPLLAIVLGILSFFAMPLLLN